MNLDLSEDRALQYYFEGLSFIVDGIKRQCYYCTLEQGGGWFWLRKNGDDINKANSSFIDINFVVDSEDKFDELLKALHNDEDVKEFGELHVIRRFTDAEEKKMNLNKPQ